MASSNSRGRSNRGGRNNNSSGRNQYTGGGMIDMVRDRPIAAATAAVGAAAAGVFLWSKRSQISNQLSNLSDQIGEWTENMMSSDSSSGGDDTAGLSTSSQKPARSQRGMSETGGGNASLGRTTGGGGSQGSASGRGRAQSDAATQE